MKILIIVRLLDIYSTLLNINKWGMDVEGNPLVRKTLELGIFIPVQIFYIGLIIVIAELLPKYRTIIYISLSSLSFLIAVNNLLCYLLIK